jgi:hypothetical protein
MFADSLRIRRRLFGAAVAMVFVLSFSLPAAAAGSVSCGGAGHLYTTGKASGTSQYHWVDAFGSTGNLGTGTKTVYWGAHSGTYNYDIYGIGIYYENATCPI